MSCQQSKIHRHTKSSVSNFELPSPRFQTVHIDIVGPLPTVPNPADPYSVSPYRYLLTCIDRATRWIEAQPLSDITAQTVAQAFVSTWISRFGVPLHVITDRGAQFESEMFRELSSVIGFHRLRTTAYHPQSNGMIERAHRTIKSALKARKENWLQALPVILLGIRNTPNENGFSPFSTVTGTSLLIPKLMVDADSADMDELNNATIKELAKEMLKLDARDLASGKSHSFPKTFIPEGLQTCDKVWLRVDRVRKPLEAPYSGPYKVIERMPKHFCIQLSDDVHSSVSIDRLKPVIEPVPNVARDNNVPPIQPEGTDNEHRQIENSIPVQTDNQDDASNIREQDISGPATKNTVPPQGTTSSSGRKLRFRKHNDYFYF